MSNSADKTVSSTPKGASGNVTQGLEAITKSLTVGDRLLPSLLGLVQIALEEVVEEGADDGDRPRRATSSLFKSRLTSRCVHPSIKICGQRSRSTTMWRQS